MKLTDDEPLSNVAFSYNLRHYGQELACKRMLLHEEEHVQAVQQEAWALGIYFSFLFSPIGGLAPCESCCLLSTQAPTLEADKRESGRRAGYTTAY